jgi:hypothetical protein
MRIHHAGRAKPGFPDGYLSEEFFCRQHLQTAHERWTGCDDRLNLVQRRGKGFDGADQGDLLPFAEKVRAQNWSDKPARLDQPSLPHSFLQILCPTKTSGALVLQELVIAGNGLTKLRHFGSVCQIYSFTSPFKVRYVHAVARAFTNYPGDSTRFVTWVQ